MDKVLYTFAGLTVAAGIYLTAQLPPNSGILVAAYLGSALASAVVWVWMGLLLAKLDELIGTAGVDSRRLKRTDETLQMLAKKE